MTFAHHPVSPGELWTSWRPDPVALGSLALAAVLYRQGLATIRTRDGRQVVRRGRIAAFWAALAVLAAVLVSPLEAAAGALFSLHMVQHLGLIVVAAPLLAYSAPGGVLQSALPLGPRRQLRATRHHRAVRRAVRTAGHPLAAWGAGTAVLWAWHLPSLYDAAVVHDAVHAAEHAALLGTATWLWAAILARRRSPATLPVGVLLLFATGLQGAALGAVLTLARVPLYEAHEALAPAWGVTPLEDQQLAGALMWVPPGLVYLAVMAGLLARWFSTLDARDREPARPATGETA